MKNLLLPIVFVFFTTASLFAQEVDITDFETGSPTATGGVGGSIFTTIANPLQTGLNTSATCGKINRSDAATQDWWTLVDIPCTFTIPTDGKKYIHIMVKYDAVPTLGVRYNTSGTVFESANNYDSNNLGVWQDLVCEMTATNEISVTQLRINPDCADYTQNANFILNNTDQFALIDEIIVNDDPTPRSLPTYLVDDVEHKKYTISSFNGKISFKKADDAAEQVYIYNSLGALVKTSNEIKFDFNAPASGIYILKFGIVTEKVFVK